MQDVGEEDKNFKRAFQAQDVCPAPTSRTPAQAESHGTQHGMSLAMVDMHAICTDLHAEHAALDALLVGLNEAGWDTPTPAPGWTVRDQISHLGSTDRTATIAAAEPRLDLLTAIGWLFRCLLRIDIFAKRPDKCFCVW